jgi:type VI secretion system protein ImpK
MADSASVAVMGGSVDLATTHFRLFYSEIERARRMALRATEVDAEAVAANLSKQLVQVIEMQTLEVRRVGGKAGVDTENQSRFLKAVLADELMLNLDWAGRNAWRHVLLEATLFRSSLAGDKVFNEIEQILLARESAQRRAAALYLHVLSLGFQGRVAPRVVSVCLPAGPRFARPRPRPRGAGLHQHFVALESPASGPHQPLDVHLFVIALAAAGLV